MPSKLLSSITGGGGLPRLAPDLTYPSSLISGTGYKRITVNATGALTTVLSLTGKFAVDRMEFAQLLAEGVTVKLTIDGVVIWNDTFTAPAANTIFLFGLGTPTANTSPSTMQCNSSLLLELQTTTDTVVDFQYIARPIL